MCQKPLVLIQAFRPDRIEVANGFVNSLSLLLLNEKARQDVKQSDCLQRCKIEC